MKLVLDLGNSCCKWALADTALRHGGAIGYGSDFAPDLDRIFGPLERPAHVAAVSVADTAHLETLTQWVKRHWSLDVRRLHARASQCGVTNTYEVPARLGADRWAALIAARARLTSAVCVIDCGTAVTVDALDAHGVFRGGVILPGLALQRASLLQGTQEIRVVEGNASVCLARNTADAAAAGTAFGLAGAIDRILDEQATLLGAVPSALLTGGDARTLQVLLRHSVQIVPDLVLEGVALASTEDAP